MKNYNLFSILLIFAVSLLMTQCTSDPIAGPAGTDGMNGVDGADGTASCIACHSESHRQPIMDAFDLSKHGDETIMYTGDPLSVYANSVGSYCIQCHTHDGYVEYQTTGAVQGALALPTGISCTTCHSSHTTFDFEADGPDYALTNTDAHNLIVDNTYTIDYGNTSNNCISCHQPRTAAPSDDGMGTFTVTNTHWGPHHSPQATLLEGLGGALIAGSESYPTVASSAHRTGSSCVSCHMGDTTDGDDGAHTMWPTENACTTCHANGIPAEVSGLAANLLTLEGLLENVVSQDGLVTGIVHEGHPQVGTFTILEAQAAWNYLTVMEDRSNGIHNPDYAKALITNSIEALQ